MTKHSGQTYIGKKAQEYGAQEATALSESWWSDNVSDPHNLFGRINAQGYEVGFTEALVELQDELGHIPEVKKFLAARGLGCALCGSGPYP